MPQQRKKCAEYIAENLCFEEGLGEVADAITIGPPPSKIEALGVPAPQKRRLKPKRISTRAKWASKGI
jgi:hypothetical protein